MDEALGKRIGGWVRQNRLRAKKYGCLVDLATESVLAIYKSYGDKCVYCEGLAGSPDLAFPIKEKAPCVPANVVPCCEECRIKKNNRDIIAYCKAGGINKNAMRSLVVQMIAREGGVHLKVFMRKQIS